MLINWFTSDYPLKYTDSINVARKIGLCFYSDHFVIKIQTENRCMKSLFVTAPKTANVAEYASYFIYKWKLFLSVLYHI